MLPWISRSRRPQCVSSDREGAVVLETDVASDPDALADCLAPYHLKLARLGLEAGPLSELLVRGLERHGFRAVLMETRHVRAALSARIAKTDRKDARGMADLLRMGWFRPVHVKSMDAREHRALPTARSTLVRRLKDIENSVRGLLRGFRIKLATTLRAQWDTKVREAIAGHPALPAILEPLLVARAALRDQVALIDGWR